MKIFTFQLVEVFTYFIYRDIQFIQLVLFQWVWGAILVHNHLFLMKRDLSYLLVWMHECVLFCVSVHRSQRRPSDPLVLRLFVVTYSLKWELGIKGCYSTQAARTVSKLSSPNIFFQVMNEAEMTIAMHVFCASMVC